MINIGLFHSLLIVLLSVIVFIPSASYSHRSGCHRWHSCPSDRGTYICGDTGYCSKCPDNQYCENGKPRVKQSPTRSPQISTTKNIENEFRTVTRVVDGDTIILSGGERVRLIGVDTPETVHPNKPVERYGKEASAFTKNMVEGKRVKLEYDIQLKDKYGRTLGYVYLPDGSMINALLVKEGYAQVMTIPPNVKYADMFLALQKEAREQKRGLWE